MLKKTDIAKIRQQYEIITHEYQQFQEQNSQILTQFESVKQMVDIRNNEYTLLQDHYEKTKAENQRISEENLLFLRQMNQLQNKYQQQLNELNLIRKERELKLENSLRMFTLSHLQLENITKSYKDVQDNSLFHVQLLRNVCKQIEGEKLLTALFGDDISISNIQKQADVYGEFQIKYGKIKKWLRVHGVIFKSILIIYEKAQSTLPSLTFNLDYCSVTLRDKISSSGPEDVGSILAYSNYDIKKALFEIKVDNAEDEEKWMSSLMGCVKYFYSCLVKMDVLFNSISNFNDNDIMS